MPELPEVETTRRGLETHIINRKVERVVIRQHSLRWPVPEDLEEHLHQQPLLSLGRRGKYLLFQFPAGHMIAHLGMSGSLRIVTPAEDPGYHDHLDIEFAGGIVVRFNDPRRFGAILWTGEPLDEHKLLQHLGPEPLTQAFDADYLFQKSRKRKQAVKTFIMDSKVVVGVGNIYANEALFKAGIRPTRAAGSISRSRYQRLTQEIKQTLGSAIEQGGTTLRDFVGGDGKPGYFQQQLSVYGRQGLACKNCARPLIEVRLAQRSTVHCKHCQT